MAANIESRPNEKDASLQSSVAGAGGQTHAARNLDERRRSALAHIDNASFSSVKKKKTSLLHFDGSCLLSFLAGSTLRFVPLLVLGSSPMRESH